MAPLFFANWRVIHQRFCVVIWLVAMALVVVILGHLGATSAACASSAAPHASACACGREGGFARAPVSSCPAARP